MAADSELIGIIQAQHEVNRETAGALARIEQTLSDNSARLFGAPGQQGVIPYLHEETTKNKAEVEKLKTWKRGVYKWVAGAIAVLTFEGGILVFVFSHLSTIDSVVKAAHK